MPVPPVVRPKRVSPPPKRREGLRQDRVGLVRQLGQQRLDGGRVRLVDTAGGDELVDQVLRVLAESPDQGRADVEHGELGGQRRSNLPCQAGADFVDPHVEHHFGSPAAQALQQACRRLHERLFRADGNGVLRLLRRNETQVKQHAQQVHRLVELLLRTHVRQIESPQRHTLEGAPVFERIGGEQQLPRRQRHPEGLGDVHRRIHRGGKVHVLDVEANSRLLHRIVKLSNDAVSLRNLREQPSGVAAIVKIVVRLRRLQLDGRGLFHHPHALARRLHLCRQRVAQPLNREVVGRVVLGGAPELRHGDDLFVLQHRLVAALQRLHHQLLARELAGGDVLQVMRAKLGRLIELVVRLVQLARGLELYAFLEIALGLGQLFGRFRGDNGRSRRHRRKRWLGLR